MHREFHGECTCHAESDVHMPHLTVNQTLTLPARARAPCGSEGTKENGTKSGRTAHARETITEVLGALNLLRAADTKIGSVFVPGPESAVARERELVSRRLW